MKSIGYLECQATQAKVLAHSKCVASKMNINTLLSWLNEITYRKNIFILIIVINFSIKLFWSVILFIWVFIRELHL